MSGRLMASNVKLSVQICNQQLDVVLGAKVSAKLIQKKESRNFKGYGSMKGMMTS